MRLREEFSEGRLERLDHEFSNDEKIYYMLSIALWYQESIEIEIAIFCFFMTFKNTVFD